MAGPVLRFDQDGNGKGEFRSLLRSFKFLAEPTGASGAGEAPTHRVYLVTEFGEVEAGAMWCHAISRGENKGGKLYSVTVDDPSFDHALNFGAFPTADKSVFSVQWNRPRRRGQPVESDPGERAAA